MKRKITTILLAMLLVIGTAIGLCACANQEDIDNALRPVEQQVTLINTTLDDMKATDKTLNDSITALTGRVTTLEGELETAKNNIGSVSSSLTQEIADREADIKTLQDKDTALQAQITALETALANKEKGIKDWANGVFVTISDWTACKNEINTMIAGLTSRIETLESSVGKINSTLTEMKATDASLKSSIDGLTTRVTALEGELETAKNNIGSISTALEKEIADRKADIKTLQDKDTALQAQITALETALTNQEQSIKDWANGVFMTISDWTACKNEINTTITGLTGRIETLESTVGKINSTLTDMKATDTSLKNSIDGLTTRVTALEVELVEVNAKITSLQTDSATKAELENVKTALQKQIDSLNAEITALKAKDTELQNQITALQNSLTVEITGVKDWANNIFLSIQNWNTAKKEIDDKISDLNTKFVTIEFTLDMMNSVITALQQQVEQNKQDIADLTIRVNCLEGKHVVDTTTITYTWADDFSTCTASITCVHCGTVNETANSTISDRTCTVSFANEAFSTQTYDLTDLTNMTADQQAKALSVILAAKPTTLTLNLPKDFNSFSLINDLIKSYDKDKYIDLTLKGVETIPEKAFFQNNKLKSITFGDSVKMIGKQAFCNCTSLTSVTFEEGIKLETIGEYAFNYSAITEITIPKSVTSIDCGAFYACIALKSITFENGTKLETIGDHALHATAITSITVPKSVTEIGDWAFAENSSLKTVIFEAGSKLKTIGDYVFHTCSALTGITIPEGTTSTGEGIFQSCSKLASVTLPSSLTTIGNAAFWSCTSLESIIIPEKTTSIPELLFYGCTALKSITFKGVIEAFDISAFAGVTEEDCTLTLAAGQKKLVCVGVTDMVYVPSEDIFCDKTEFCGMTFKEIIFTIVIDATNMSASDLQTTLESYTGRGATNLELTLAKDAGSDVFSAIVSGIHPGNDGTINLTLSGVETIPDNAFYDNSLLKSITLGKGVKTIGEGAFGSRAYPSLESVTIGPDVETIKKGAFAVTKITKINIPDNVTTIEENAFANNEYLASVTLGKGISMIPDYAFYKCTSLENVTIPSNITTVGILAFSGSGLTSVVIPDTVTSIGEAAFSGCKELSSVTIGSGITAIESQMFKECTALKSITIPSTVKSIGKSAFSGSGLTSVTVPDSVTLLGANAFSGCEALTSITIGKGVTNMNKNVFRGDTALTEITFRGVITEAEYLIFNNITTANITLTLAEGQKLLTGGDDDNPWAVAGDDLIYGGTVFCGSTFKNIVAPQLVKIDATTMSASDLQTALGNYVSKGATNFEITLAANADSDVFKAIKNGFASASEKSVTLVLKGDITSIPLNAFRESKWIKSISIPDSVTSIGVRAFYDSTLETITFGENSALTSIEGYAFQNCSNLSGIIIPKGVTTTGYAVFSGCSSLVNITLPDKLETIKQDLFYKCVKLESVTLGKNVASIELRVFWGTSIKEIIIPKSVTSIGYAVFADCKLLETIKYEGTSEEWDAIIKTDQLGSWNAYISETAKVVCSGETVTP